MNEQPRVTAPTRAQEPVWLVRIVLILVLIGFTAFVAREAWRLTH